jgi:hypothetical protein
VVVFPFAFHFQYFIWRKILNGSLGWTLQIVNLRQSNFSHIKLIVSTWEVSRTYCKVITKILLARKFRFGSSVYLMNEWMNA